MVSPLREANRKTEYDIFKAKNPFLRLTNIAPRKWRQKSVCRIMEKPIHGGGRVGQPSIDNKTNRRASGIPGHVHN